MAKVRRLGLANPAPFCAGAHYLRVPTLDTSRPCDDSRQVTHSARPPAPADHTQDGVPGGAALYCHLRHQPGAGVLSDAGAHYLRGPGTRRDFNSTTGRECAWYYSLISHDPFGPSVYLSFTSETGSGRPGRPSVQTYAPTCSRIDSSWARSSASSGSSGSRGTPAGSPRISSPDLTAGGRPLETMKLSSGRSSS
jgi:hypothetical protein